MGLSVLGGFTEGTEQVKIVQTPEHSNLQAGRIYQDVVKDFKDHGFTNVKTKAIDDLILGWITKDGEVKSVSVDGNLGYLTDDSYPADVEVIVTYHTFPIEDENTEEENQLETIHTSENIEEENQLETIYTAENCEDLNHLLKHDDISIAEDFAHKYHNEIIQFEGNIAHMMNHDTYTTRFDFLIYENIHQMVPFKFNDCSYYDLKLVGDYIPDNVHQGQNYIITAKVVEYNPISGLFFLDPVSLEYVEKTL
ncbi:hypothetical protein AN639_07145 [Candidatus Epulonipiscium fishelsonii]|uniref:Uncharacterized protein n=1 Tax=Candidatus Epulonipiscium fishelsonii TaxID=77094 RepID=A0ACC8XAT4_9FIRM|nr:hypothetical protein AN639_07145 [Epulopiscium sp. SCG-B05WGA-EpuloA1]ONI39495.1 hypothetical protein AN396_08420 [Epulopiscium sp. SCG-B11WGA-EpuloA1]